MSRINELLKLGAEDLANGMSFPHGEFLCEHNVHIDDAYGMTEKAGLIIKGFLACPERIQNAILLLAASDGLLTWDSVEQAARMSQMRELREKIQNA